MATEPPGGLAHQGYHPKGPLLDKEQERREIPMRHSLLGNGRLVGGPGKISRRAAIRVAQVRPPITFSLIHRPLSDLRFWGWEFEYDGSVACVRRGGVFPRKGKNALKDPNPVASTSVQPEEYELLDDEQDEDGDEAMPDETFDADWSRDFMCVADPFIVGKVRIFPLLR
jgi:hypothetical protein